MQFLDNYRGNHLAGASLVELLPQLNLLSTQKVAKCLVSFDGGKTWRYPLENDTIGSATLLDIETLGVPFEVLHEKLVDITDDAFCVAFSVLFPNTTQPVPYVFYFTRPLNHDLFIIDTTKQPKV